MNIYDLSSDPVAYASERCELVNDLLPSIVENFAPGVDSHQEVLRAYYSLTGEYATGPHHDAPNRRRPLQRATRTIGWRGAIPRCPKQTKRPP